MGLGTAGAVGGLRPAETGCAALMDLKLFFSPCAWNHISLCFFARLHWHDEAVKVHPVADLEAGLLEVLGGLLFGEGDQLRKQRLAVLSLRSQNQNH